MTEESFIVEIAEKGISEFGKRFFLSPVSCNFGCTFYFLRSDITNALTHSHALWLSQNKAVGLINYIIFQNTLRKLAHTIYRDFFQP